MKHCPTCFNLQKDTQKDTPQNTCIACKDSERTIEQVENDKRCVICGNPTSEIELFEFLNDFGPNEFCHNCTQFMSSVAPLPIEAIMYQFQKIQTRQRRNLKTYLVETGYEFVDKSYENF